MNYERSQTPTTGPFQAPAAPQSSPAFSPLLGLQGLIGNSGVLDLLRPQMPGAQPGAGSSPIAGALQTVLQQDATAPTPPPGGTEAPSTAVAATLADQGQTAALTSAPSSPAQSSAAQVTALDETQDGVEGAITASPALTTAIAAELGTTPSDVQAQAQDPWQPSWWDDAVDWTVGGVGGLVDGGVDLLSDVPVLGTAAATMAPVTKFAWETLGGFAKGAGDLVGGLGHMVAHPLDTLSGLATMAEHIPFSPLKPLHKLYDVATTDKTLEETFWRNPLDVAGEDLSADWEFWKKVGGAVIDPYERSVEQGKYGEALGRGIFDIGGLFVGASEVKALGKGAETVSLLNKVDDSVKVAGKVNELGTITDDLVRAGGKAEDVTKAASHVDEVADLSKADDATKLASQADNEAALIGPTQDDAATIGSSAQDNVTGLADAPAQATTPVGEAVGHADEALQVATHTDEATNLGKVEDSHTAQADQPAATNNAATPQAAVDEVADLAFQLDPKKHDYFFGRVERPPEALKASDPKQYEKLMHNYHRSQQLKGVFEGMGIADSPEGRKSLEGLFQEGTSAPAIAEHKGAYGTTVTRAVERDGVILEIKYFYDGGDMASKPKVVTVIPKVKK